MDLPEPAFARQLSAEHLIATKALRSNSYGLEAHYPSVALRSQVSKMVQRGQGRLQGPLGAIRSAGVRRQARHRSAEHLIATKALFCTATAWILTVAQRSAIPRQGLQLQARAGLCTIVPI